MSKKEKRLFYPGDEIAKRLIQNRHMQVYGLWSVFGKRIACYEEDLEAVIDLISEDPIAFNLLIELGKADETTEIFEFKDAHNREKLIKKISLGNVLAMAPNSNYIATFVVAVEEKKTRVYFLDLRKVSYF